MEQWIYISRASLHISENNIQDILHTSRANNLKHSLTGILLYRDQQFFQTLEGPKAELSQVKSKILKDPRHTDITTLHQCFTDKRTFENWAMAYASDDAEELSPYHFDLTEESTAIKLLKRFKSLPTENSRWVLLQ